MIKIFALNLEKERYMINTKTKRLVVFGDSYTFGYGLPDTMNNSVPSKLGWPNILAKHYNLQLCNKAIGGGLEMIQF